MEYIYILSNLNESHNGILKIGRTHKHPEIRAHELSKQTASLGKFIVEWYVEVPDSKIAEKIIHNKLSEFRINESKEFFELDVEYAIQITYEVLTEYFKTNLTAYRDTKRKNVIDVHKILNDESLLRKWWKELPNTLKYAFIEHLPEEYLENNIDSYLEENHLDHVYLLLRKDYLENGYKELKGIIAWERHEFLSEMLFYNSGGDYEIFLENAHSILLMMSQHYQHWFINTLAKNEIEFLTFKDLQEFYTTKTVSLSNSDLTEFEKESNIWKEKDRVLRNYFPFLENLKIDITYLSDFIRLNKLSYLKSIHLGKLNLLFDTKPFNAIDDKGNLYFEENDTPEDLEGQLLDYYLYKNVDIQMLKEFLRTINQLQIPVITFIIDVENAKYIYENYTNKIILDFFPNKVIQKRIYEPIFGSEFTINKNK